MTVGSIRKGDIVHCDVRGQRFFAVAVGDAGDGVVSIRPVAERSISVRSVRARQVIGHWRRRKGSQV